MAPRGSPSAIAAGSAWAVLWFPHIDCSNTARARTRALQGAVVVSIGAWYGCRLWQKRSAGVGEPEWIHQGNR